MTDEEILKSQSITMKATGRSNEGANVKKKKNGRKCG